MRDEAFELIRSLLDKIVLVPEGEELQLEIHGELAGSWSCASKANARSRASAEQIKVVARDFVHFSWRRVWRAWGTALTSTRGWSHMARRSDTVSACMIHRESGSGRNNGSITCLPGQPRPP
jgi:hypothetical protein